MKSLSSSSPSSSSSVMRSGSSPSSSSLPSLVVLASSSSSSLSLYRSLYRGLRDYCATGLVLAGGHAAEDEGGRMHRDEEVKEVEGRDCGVLVHMFPPLRMNED